MWNVASANASQQRQTYLKCVKDASRSINTILKWPQRIPRVPHPLQRRALHPRPLHVGGHAEMWMTRALRSRPTTFLLSPLSLFFFSTLSLSSICSFEFCIFLFVSSIFTLRWSLTSSSSSSSSSSLSIIFSFTIKFLIQKWRRPKWVADRQKNGFI